MDGNIHSEKTVLVCGNRTYLCNMEDLKKTLMKTILVSTRKGLMIYSMQSPLNV